jgi:hypothetical protein
VWNDGIYSPQLRSFIMPQLAVTEPINSLRVNGVQTHNEYVNGNFFNWNQALLERSEGRTIERPSDGLTPLQISKKAGSWTTCACGNLCEILPRDGDEPEDEELRELGLTFMYVLQRAEREMDLGDTYRAANIYRNAHSVLRLIEQRSVKCLLETGMVEYLDDANTILSLKKEYRDETGEQTPDN